jgi:PAS domain S-box-containing protein
VEEAMQHRLETDVLKRIVVVPISLATSWLLAVGFRPFLHNQAQLLPFTLAVVMSACYGGLWPGLVTTGLSFAIADYFFTEPLYKLLSVYPGDYAALVLFLMFGISTSILSHLHRKASAALRETNQRLELSVNELARSNGELQRFDEAQKSGDYARAIVETIHEALVVVDSECRVLTVNRSFCNLLRVSPQSMKRQSFFGPGAGQCNAPRFRELLQDVLSKGTEITYFEVDQHFPEIGRRRLVLNARRIDATQTILIAVEDLTERKQAQEELERKESTIRALLDSATQSVVAVSADRKIVLVNANTEKMFGYSRGELLGQPLEMLVPKSAQERHVEHHGAYFANMQSRPMGIGLDLAGRRKDGTNFPVEIGLSAIKTASGKLAVAFVSDITERRRLEQTAQAHAREVQALAASLLTAQEEERRRVSRELHDQVCQQLASLAIDIGGLAADHVAEDEQQRLKLKALQARIVQASEETRHIAYQLHPSVLDDLGVVASLRGLCKEFSERATNMALECTDVALPASVPREVASCLYRVAQESLQNIAKHAKAKHVSVALTLQKGTVVLSIADDGVGFDPEAVKGRGGLGLIGMEERARMVSGKLSIAAQPGHGTRIALEVPLPADSL